MKSKAVPYKVLVEPAVTSSMLEAAARKEAGHAVMRWLRLRKPSFIWLHRDLPVDGVCEPAFESDCRKEDVILILLAGLAAQTGYGLKQIDFTHVWDWPEVKRARELIGHAEVLQAHSEQGQEPSIEALLKNFYKRACEELRESGSHEVDHISRRLMQNENAHGHGANDVHVWADEFKAMILKLEEQRAGANSATRQQARAI